MTDDVLAIRIRDVVNEAACGSVQRRIALDEIRRRLDLDDAAACQEALRRAVAAGWLEADPDPQDCSVRITFDGIAACHSSSKTMR